MGITVGEIAHLVGGALLGDPATEITGVNGLQEAGPGDLCFVRSARYYPLLQETRASAVLLPEPVENLGMAGICVPQPEAAFLQVLHLFAQKQASPPPMGVHPAAWVSPDAVLAEGVSVGPCANIAAGARIGARSVIHAGVSIGQGVIVGEDCIVYPNVTLRESVQIGNRCILHAGACIGSDGFGFVPVDGRWMKIPQVGIVVIGDDVEIGSNTAVDRATFGVTFIGSGTKIDNLVQIGHNVRMGEHCVIAGMAGVAGSATIGNQVRIGANAGVNGHISVGDGASIGARSGVMKSVAPGKVVSGFPAVEHSQERRILVAHMQLPEVLKRLRQLELRLAALEKPSNETTDDC